MAIAHIAFYFRSRHQRRHGIHNNHIYRIGPHQHIADFQRLLSGIRLRNQHIVNIDTQLLGIDGVQSVFGIDKGTSQTLLLSLDEITAAVVTSAEDHRGP